MATGDRWPDRRGLSPAQAEPPALAAFPPAALDALLKPWTPQEWFAVLKEQTDRNTAPTRQIEAVRLYREGMPVKLIAKRLGYGDRMSVYDALKSQGVSPNRRRNHA